MSTEVRLRRDTNVNLLATVPAQGEVGMDVTNSRLVLGDGSKAGGVPHASYYDVQRQTMTAANAGGTNNITITLNSQFSPGAYANLQKFSFKAGATNTGGMTANVNGLGQRNIRKIVGGVKTALAAGDVVDGIVYELTYDGTDFQIGSPEKGLAAGSVTQVELAANSVGTSELDNGNGSISKAFGIMGWTHITLPGGAYGFYPRCYSSVAVRGADVVFAQTNVALPTSATAIIAVNTSASPFTGTFYAQQYYMIASPPYDLGDGEIPLFMFALVDSNGEVVAGYAAETPPWAYNGPTKVVPDLRVDGQGYRRAFIPAAHANGTEQSIAQAMIDRARGRLAFSPRDELVEVLVPITQQVKNADMDLIPHPFPVHDPALRVVMLDTQSPVVARAAELTKQGESACELLHDWMVVDNTAARNRAPAGVLPMRCRWRNTRRS